MKKLFVSAVCLLGFGFGAHAQDISKNALGLRLGDNDGFGGEITYQRGLSKKNRLELDLGWRNNKNYDAYKLVGIYQWVWNIDKGFNWYAGFGPGIGNQSVNYFGVKDSSTYVLAAGDLGIEYNFDVPIQLSLDIRPEFYFADGLTDNSGTDIALGIKYRF